MAEAVGLTLAGAGLLSLFSTCLDVLDIIDTASSYGRDVSLLNQMFDNQRYRLVMWANARFRSPASFDNRLSDALPRAQIENNLQCIHLLLEDESRLQKHFGLSKARRINNVAVTTPQNAVFQHDFVVFRNRIRQTQQTASLKEIVRWSIRDRKKFLELINFLKTYIDGLWDVAKSLGLGHLQREEAETTMHTVPDEVSQSVAAPAVISGDPLSDAALARNLGRLSVADQTRPQLQLPAMSSASSQESQRQEEQAVAVLFVDYGNSCRSPMAEAVFKSKTANEDRVGTVDSAGVGNDFWLKPVDQRTIFTLYRHGINIQTREPRRISARDFLEFDYVLAMDKDTLSRIAARRNELEHPGSAVVKLFGGFAPDEEVEVIDPFFKDFEAFEDTYAELARMSTNFMSVVLGIEV